MAAFTSEEEDVVEEEMDGLDTMWPQLFSSIDNLLEIQNADSDNNLSYHDAALFLNRLETALSVTRSLQDLVLTNQLQLTESGEQLLAQLCGMLAEIQRYWGHKMLEMRRVTVSLADITYHVTNIRSRSRAELNEF